MLVRQLHWASLLCFGVARAVDGRPSRPVLKAHTVSPIPTCHGAVCSKRQSPPLRLRVRRHAATATGVGDFFPLLQAKPDADATALAFTSIYTSGERRGGGDARILPSSSRTTGDR